MVLFLLIIPPVNFSCDFCMILSPTHDFRWINLKRFNVIIIIFFIVIIIIIEEIQCSQAPLCLYEQQVTVLMSFYKMVNFKGWFEIQIKFPIDWDVNVSVIKT